jgi:hypothetical protein
MYHCVDRHVKLAAFQWVTHHRRPTLPPVTYTIYCQIIQLKVQVGHPSTPMKGHKLESDQTQGLFLAVGWRFGVVVGVFGRCGNTQLFLGKLAVEKLSKDKQTP